MADNLAITPGTGANIATDDIGGNHFQRVKLTLGADGVNDGDVSSSNPVPVTVSSLPASPATTALEQVSLSGSDSQSLIASRAGRRGLIIYNGSGSTVKISFGATCSNTVFSFELTNGQTYEAPYWCYTGAVTCKGASGTVYVTEAY